jgi:DNA-binding MltR family transcriptional regulator
MVWVTYDDAESEAIKEIRALSDRAAAIVAATLVEATIERVLKNSFVQAEDVQAQIFRTSGPLGSFSAKIKMGYLTRLYEVDLYNDLELFKEIRNEFAHRARAKDFNSQRVRDLTRNFKLIDLVAMDPQTGPHEPKHRMMVAVDDADNKRKIPRERYLISAQIFLLAFAMTPVPGPAGVTRISDFRIID